MPTQLTLFPAFGALVLASGCWGGATVLSKDALGSIPAVTLLLLQLCASVGFLWLILVLRRESVRFNTALFRSAIYGILEPGIAYLLVLIGLTNTSASTTSLIAATEPLMVMALGVLILRDHPSRRLVLAAVGSIVGIALTLQPVGATDVYSGMLGALLIALGTFVASIYVLFSKGAMQDQSPLLTAAAQQTVGALLIGAIWLGWFRSSEGDALNGIPTSTIAVAALSGVIQYGLAFWAYLVGIKRLAVPVAALFLNLIPLFTIVVSGLYLNEWLSPMQWIGAVILLVAVVSGICQSPPARQEVAPSVG
jgi:drug/metabolite transporter (DMT)-like permease